MSSPWTLSGFEETYQYRYDPSCPENLKLLGDVLRSWEGTPYAEGSQVRGVGADCIRALCGVADELLGTSTAPEMLPADAAMTDPESARAGMRVLLRTFKATEVSEEVLRPVDFLVTRPPGRDTGPGHAMIVGHTRSVWHMDRFRGFCNVGNSLEGNMLVGVYRIAALWEHY